MRLRAATPLLRSLSWGKNTIILACPSAQDQPMDHTIVRANRAVRVVQEVDRHLGPNGTTIITIATRGVLVIAFALTLCLSNCARSDVRSDAPAQVLKSWADNAGVPPAVRRRLCERVRREG